MLPLQLLLTHFGSSLSMAAVTKDCWKNGPGKKKKKKEVLTRMCLSFFWWQAQIGGELKWSRGFFLEFLPSAASCHPVLATPNPA